MNIQGLDLDLCVVLRRSQGHIATSSLQVEESSAYCTVNHWSLAGNYQLSNMKHPARDSAVSEVGGENSNCYTSEPPQHPRGKKAYLNLTGKSTTFGF